MFNLTQFIVKKQQQQHPLKALLNLSFMLDSNLFHQRIKPCPGLGTW